MRCDGLASGDTLGGTLIYTYYNNSYDVETGIVAVGTYSIRPDGLISNNYDIAYVNGTLTVVAASAATETNELAQGFEVNYSDPHPTYNGAEQTAPAISAAETEESAAGPVKITRGEIELTADDYEIKVVAHNTQPVSTSTTAATLKDAKTYDVWALFKGNYTGAAWVGTYTIEPKPVTVSGFAAQDKDYDQKSTVDLTGGAIAEGNICEGDTLSFTATGSFADANVARDSDGNVIAQNVNISIGLTGNSKDNYELSENSQRSATAKINPITVSLSWSGDSDNHFEYTYTGDSAGIMPAVSVSDALTGDTVTATNVGVEAQEGSQLTNGKAINVGSYTATVKELSNGNYALPTDGTESQAFTIEKVAAILSGAPTAKELTYSGSAQELVNAGTASGGSMQYCQTETNVETAPADGWNAAIPTGTDAKDYRVWYKVVGDGNHTDLTSDSYHVDVTIGKKAVTVAAKPQTVALNGSIASAVGQATLSGGVEGHSLSVITLTLSSGTATSSAGTFSGVIVPGAATIVSSDGDTAVDVTSNYEITYINGDLTVEKGTITIGGDNSSITAPTAKTGLTYDGSEQALVNAGSCSIGGTKLMYALGTSSGAPEGTVWSEDIPTGTTAETYYVWYYVDGGSNYASTVAMGPVEVSIGEAESSVTAAPTALNPTYSGSEQALISAGSASNGTLMYFIREQESSPTTETSGWSDAVPQATNAGTYYIYYYVRGNTNYSDTAIAGPVTATIQKAEGTIVAGSAEWTYGTNNAVSVDLTTLSSLFTVSDLTSGDRIYSLVTGDEAGTGAGQIAEDGKTLIVTSAGTFSINLTIEADGNHAPASSTTAATLTVHAKGITITADNQSIQYGKSIETGANKAAASGIVDGDELTRLVLTPSISDVTTNGTITPGNAIITRGSGESAVDVTGCYTIEYRTGVLTINAVNPIAVDSSENLQAGQYHVSSYTGDYDGAEHSIVVNVGSGLTVKYKGASDTAYTLDSAPLYRDAGEYTVGYEISGANYNAVTQTATVKIEKKEIKVTSGFTAADKQYDGSTSAELTFNPESAIYEGAIGDDKPVVTATGTFHNENAGSDKGVSINNIALADEDQNPVNKNYRLASAGHQSSTNATITAVLISVSGITAADKAYDGNTTAELNTSGAVLSGKIGNDDLGVSATGTFSDKNVGTGKTVTISNMVLEGASAENYVLASNGQQETATAAIEAKTVSIVWSNTQVDYDGYSHVPTATVQDTDVVSGESCTVTVSGAQVNAGTYTAEASSLSNANYALPTEEASRKVQFTIRAATLENVTAAGYSGVYNGVAHGITVTVSQADVFYLASDSLLTDVAADDTRFSASQPTYTDVGTHYVYYKVEKTNFQPVLGNKTVEITPATLTITTGSANKTYDGTALTKNEATITGLVGNETASVAAIGTITHVGTAENDYSITWGTAKAGNYTVNATKGTLEVTKKALTITADSATKAYDGTVLTKNSYSSTDLASGDHIQGVTVTGSQTVVGNSLNTPSNTEIRNAQNEIVTTDYDIQYVNGTLTVTKGTAAIEIPPAAKANLVYTGEAQALLHAGTASMGTIVYYTSDTNTAPVESIDWSESIPEMIDAGDYYVWYKVAAGDNYDGSDVDGPIHTVIGKKEVILSWSNTQLTYNGEAQMPSATITNKASVADDVGVVVTVDGEHTDAGAYTATATALTGEGKDNYKLPTSVTQTFNIARKDATVTADAKNKVYGAPDPAWTATVSGTIGGDELVYTLARAKGEDVGTYAITSSGEALQGNYNVSYVASELEIIKAEEKIISLPVEVKMTSEALSYGIGAYTEDGMTFGTPSASGGVSSATLIDKAIHYSITGVGEGMITVISTNSKNYQTYSITLNVQVVSAGTDTTNVVFKEVETSGGDSAPATTSVTSATSENLKAETATQSSEASKDTSVDMTMTVTPKGTTSETSGEGVTTYTDTVDISIEKTTLDSEGQKVDDQSGKVTETNIVIEVAIKMDMTGKYNLKLERTHEEDDGTLTTVLFTQLNEKPSEGAYMDGTYYIEIPADGNRMNATVYIYSSKFSDFRFSWDVEESHSITFSANDGTGTQKTQSLGAVTDGMLEANSFTRVGYTFIGWNTAANGGGTAYADQASVTVAGDNLTLFAQWDPIIYTVSFEGNGATSGSMSAQTFTYETPQNLSLNAFEHAYTVTYNTNGGSALAASTATYTFDNWKNGENTYSDGQSVQNLTATAGEIVVLTAQWNAGSITLPTAERTGYHFAGWYSDSTLSASIGSAGTPYTPTSDITLYAKWEPITYTVSFDGNGATSGSMGAQAFTYDVPQRLNANAFSRAYTVAYDTNGGNALAASTATYAFSGWKNGNNTYSDGQSVQNLTATAGAGVVLAAQWNSGSITLPTAKRSGYNFAGWYSDSALSVSVGNAGASYTPTGNTTLYAKWTATSSGYSYGGGSSSGGSGSGGSSSTGGGTLRVPLSGEQNKVSISASMSGTTATVKAPTEAQLNSVIGAAVRTGTVVIDLGGLNKDVAAVSIPSETVKKIEAAIEDANNDARELQIKLSDGSITFDAQAMRAISDQMTGSDLRLNLDSVGTLALNSTQRTAVSEKGVVAVYDAYMTSNGVRISDFRGGSAKVTVIYTLQNGQKAEGVGVWYVADNGTAEQVPVTVGANEVMFTIEHFSHYVVTYTAPVETPARTGRYDGCAKDAACPISKYIDASPTAWYHDGVHWALENGVMGGVSPRQFKPDGSTTRAMVATMLWRLEGSPIVSMDTGFVDVSESEWYADAVRWAASVGVINGSKIPAKTAPWPMGFRPDEAVTREQLATMLYRYAQYKGMNISGWENANSLNFRDASEISIYAAPAMQWACGTGIISGMSNGTREIVLAPKNTSSRAVVATMLMRFCDGVSR